jgi:hypothetical protein
LLPNNSRHSSALGETWVLSSPSPKSGSSITPSTTRQLGDLGRPMWAEQL